MQEFHTHHYTGGTNRLVSALIKEGTHRVEAWGNSREGFTPYLVNDTPMGDRGLEFTSGVAIGPWFRRLHDLRDGVQCAYGMNIKVKQGRGF